VEWPAETHVYVLLIRDLSVLIEDIFCTEGGRFEVIQVSCIGGAYKSERTSATLVI
jgi:hypothetical protein